MSLASNSKKLVQLKLFGSRSDDAEAVAQELMEAIDEQDLNRLNQQGARRPSAYVTVFEDMINTVHDHERHLLSEAEWEALLAYQHLCYNSRYCLVRLLLLKPSRWYSLSSFEKWKREVGEEGIEPSIAPLCRPIQELLTPEPTPIKKEEDDNGREIIDLTFNSDEEDVKPNIELLKAQPLAGPSTYPTPEPTDDPIQKVIASDPRNLNLNYFCEDETNMSLEELLNRMNCDQLKRLAKKNKCAPSGKAKKADFIASLIKNATTQSVLRFNPGSAKKPKGNAPDHLRQTKLAFSPITKKPITKPVSQEDRLRKQVLEILGRCFRVNHDFFRLIRRLHIISYRCTEHPPGLMLPALLSTFKKRAYPEYEHTRDPEIWPSRQELLDFEKALELEMLLDEIIEAPEDGREATANLKDRTTTPATIALQHLKTHLRTPESISKLGILDRPWSQKVKKEEEEAADYVPEEEPIDSPDIDPKIQKARRIVKCFDEWILSAWSVQLELKQAIGMNRVATLQRFEPGYVYTRMIRKTLKALATLEEYGQELTVINTLLSQRLWMRGKRAKLYERRAVLQTRYLYKTEDGQKDYSVLYQALEGVREALLDDDTALVARPSLLRRLRRLEKQLKVPPEECAICEGELRKAEIVTIQGKRIYHRASTLKLDASGTPIRDKENAHGSIKPFLVQSTKRETPFPASQNQPESHISDGGRWKHKGKSIWQGRNGEEVTVEQLALQHYEDEGFKGFHSETSVVTTIYVLLFWDIIFAPVRGAFETAYQTAPLDIADDSFYFARKEIIEDRLTDIREGKAAEILARHDAKYREKNIWCIGVRWDICEQQDLIEIVQCVEPNGLAGICRLFCEDYAGRSSGVPDNIAWNFEKRLCKFVEVKGPGDTPQENQKLWFDFLLGAGVHVEICKVEDINDVKTQNASRGKRKASAMRSTGRRKRTGKRPTKGTFSESEEEQDYDKLDPNSEDELPQPGPSTKKRRLTDPGYESLAVFPVSPAPSISTPCITKHRQ